MNYPKYEVESSSSHLQFDFFSIGPKGKIKKRIIFTNIPKEPLVYNLGFGDVDLNGEIRDDIISDNKDSKIILSTVAMTVYDFFSKNPQAFVFAEGSTKSRTRLYQIGISNNIHLIEKDFNVYGFQNNTWEKFRCNNHYEAFLITKK